MMVWHPLEPVPASDWYLIAALCGAILLLIAAAELLRRRQGWPEELTRKLVHVLVGVITFFSPVLLQTSLPMLLIGMFFTLGNLLALKKGWLKGMHGERFSYGTVFYPLSFLLLVLFCWPQQKLLIVAGMMVLAFADAAAAITGESLPAPHRYRLLHDYKSLEGTVAMFLTSATVLFLLLYAWPFAVAPQQGAAAALQIALSTALVVTLSEALSHKGSDNLSVPLSTAILLYAFLQGGPGEQWQLTADILTAGAAGLVSWKLRFLTANGAVALVFLAVPLYAFGGWQWTVPILLFFVLSSLLSRLGKQRKAQQDELAEKESRRDYAQVFANGGIGALLCIAYLLTAEAGLYYLYLASIAAATADTWATELGSLYGRKPRLITSGKPVAPGFSGGVSLAGLLSSLLGAALIAFSGWYFFYQSSSSPALLWLGITLAGLSGSLADSLLGATLQRRSRCEHCGRITEQSRHCGSRASIISGVGWINNNAVNALSIAAATAAMFLLLLLADL